MTKKEEILEEEITIEETKDTAKDTAGRPTKMTEETVKKLLDAFSYSFTDSEACLYANISKPTLYTYCKLHPDFLTQKEELKNTPNIKAKMNKIKAINGGNLVESGWWLERKSRDEFSLKQEIDSKINGQLTLNSKDIDSKPLEELKDGIQLLLNK